MKNKNYSIARTIHFSQITVLGLVFTSAISAQAKVYLCQDIFLNLPKVAYLEGEEQNKAIAEINESLVKRAEATEDKLQQERTIKYDVVIVGAGPHGVSAAASFKSSAPELKVLIISSDLPGHVFNNVGDAMWINSPELAGGVSSNILPGTELGLRHLGEVTDYKMASDLGNYVAATLEGSKSDLLLTKVTRISTKKSATAAANTGKQFTEELYLNNGLTVEARQVIVATGLGQPRMVIKDPKEIEAVKKLMDQESTKSQNKPRTVEIFDDAMKRWAGVIQQTPGQRPTEGYKNSDVLIIGSGDSANVLAEGLTGRGPGKLYGLTENGVVGQVQEDFMVGAKLGVKSLTIASMKATSPESFKKENKRRYDETVAVQVGIDIHGAPKVVSMMPFKSSENTYKVTVMFDNAVVKTFDHVLIATGYENNVFSLLGETSLSSTPIYGSVGGQQTIIATGIQNRNIQIAGPAAGAITNDADLANSITKNGASINVLGLKTKAMVDHIIGKLRK